MEISHKSVLEHVAKWIGREVMIEGVYPVPVSVPDPLGGPPQTMAVYLPIRGVLTRVFVDGFCLQIEGQAEERAFNFANIRAVQPFSSIAMPSKPPLSI